MNIGVLTGGGDVPGLNAAIRAVAGRGNELGHSVFGISEGWAGAAGGKVKRMKWDDVSDIIGTGGTMLGTSRHNPLATDDGLKKVVAGLQQSGIKGLVAIGGDDTLSVARALADEGFLTVGVPKTMDNDVGGTDYTIGYFTAAGIAVDAAERLRTTARSHRRIMVLEVMGRYAGWVALACGLGSGAEYTFIPELDADIDDISDRLARHYKSGLHHAVVVASEGVKINGQVTASDKRDQFGHVQLGGVGDTIADYIKKRTGIDTRATKLGHIQRGGPPALYDRMLGSYLGANAVTVLDQGKSGLMVGWRGEKPQALPLADALLEPKLVSEDWIDLLCTLQREVGC